jgi:hypothetical protein
MAQQALCTFRSLFNTAISAEPTVAIIVVINTVQQDKAPTSAKPTTKTLLIE